MEERNFYKSGKISDYLYMKEKGKGRDSVGRTHKGKGPHNTPGGLRGL